jgi:alkylation response protein AidB-like acyl-CoA dehydrogenase
MAAGLDRETLEMTLAAIGDFLADHAPESVLLELDAKDECPIDLVRSMCGSELGVQLLFIPEEYGGMGGGAFDVYRVCERLAGLDLGIATSVLATFLGSDPITVGGTPEQRKLWMTRIADEGLLMAYGATEPAAGSDLAALRTTATPVLEDGHVVAYRLNGQKQWISNGGVADLYTILANAPGGPSWFVLDRETQGFSHGKPEDKHGIRASNTAALFLEDVTVDADRLLGLEEGKGLLQAQAVFGYTRLMVAAFGLGGGWAALDRAIPYSTERIQAGAPLSEKQGYTHKLIVPHVVRLEAARAYIEESAERLDAGEGDLNTEGAIAKYMASEAGNAAADAAIQALGGYGYTREYFVEKIRRDVRITTIYEGTSEIMEMTIARDRWQAHLKSAGSYYASLAADLDALAATHPDVGAAIVAGALRSLGSAMEHFRVNRLTRNQHVLLRLGCMVANAECAAALCRRAVRAAEGTLTEKTDRRFDATSLAAMARIFARETALLIATEGLRLGIGALEPGAAPPDGIGIDLTAACDAQADLLADMNRVADVLYGRVARVEG